MIALVVLVSVPILITILAPSVSSEISADGMLGYVIQAISTGGTIFLAYVAIRQNEKFKEENDRTQERLEKIAANANELSIVAKIGGFMEDIFGKELKPWQENEKPGTEP